jgi:hypothetical protein
MSDGLQPYVARPSLYRLPGERPPAWQCVCVNRKPWQQHLEPWQCVTNEQVRAWRRRHPSATCSERTARALCWMEEAFGR